ncbi:MAG: hypothetical protein JSV62_11035 [Promethearchaeota archaeon]|nr:MAG: hypothetical protein JSV62_11035 [Candidatus Lokiarchaeota archaeon]
MRKTENLLVLGMFCLIIAFVIEMVGRGTILTTVISLLFIGIAIFSNAGYLVLTSLKNNKK